MTNEAIKKLCEVVGSPETPVSVHQSLYSQTFSFPAMIEYRRDNAFVYINDIRSLYDTEGINSMNDIERYQYTHFHVECLHTISFGIPTTICSIGLDGVEDSLETLTIPIKGKQQDLRHKLVASLIKGCSTRVGDQARNYSKYALQSALMSQNQDLQYN